MDMERQKQNGTHASRAERLDDVDLRILGAMQENARLTTKELAQRVGLSSTPVFERLRRMEREGYIKGYTAVLDADRLGRGFVVFCNVRMARMSSEIAAGFAGVVRGIPQVTECYNISGGNDYLLKVHARDMRDYRELVLNVLGRLDNLASIESIFVMDEIKREVSVPL